MSESPPREAPKGTAEDRAWMDTDEEIKAFIRAALNDYNSHSGDDSKLIGTKVARAIGWHLLRMDRMVFTDTAAGLGIHDVREMITGSIKDMVKKIFRAFGEDVVRKMQEVLEANAAAVYQLGKARAGANISQEAPIKTKIDELEVLEFGEDEWKKDTTADARISRIKKFMNMRENAESEITVNLLDVYESGRARGEIVRVLKIVRALLIALYAVSLVAKSQYRVKKSVLENDVIPIFPEMENRKTPIFELLGITNAVDKEVSKRAGKYINEALTFFYGYYAACIKRGISVTNGTVSVNDLLVANVFLLMHLVYIMATDPIIQTTLTPPPDNSAELFAKTMPGVDFDRMTGARAITGGTAEAFTYFCGGPIDAEKVIVNMENLWVTELSNISILDSGVDKFIAYGRVRKHHAKILRQATRDIFQRDAGQRICDSIGYINAPAELRERVHRTMPIHARYGNFNEDTGFIEIPQGEFVGVLGGGAQRHLKEESKEKFVRTLDESVNIHDVERLSQFLADKTPSIFDFSRKSTKDTTESEAEVAGDMGFRKFGDVLNEKFQFIRDDIVSGDRRNLLSFLRVVNNEQFIGEMLEGLLTSGGSDWNYMGNEMTGKMKLFTVICCGAPLNAYPVDFAEAIHDGVKYNLDFYKMLYTLNSMISVNSTGEGQSLSGVGGIPKNTQIRTLAAMERFSRQIEADGRYRYKEDDNLSNKLKKIIRFCNEVVVALIRDDGKWNLDSVEEAKARFSTMRKQDKMTFGSWIVRDILLPWATRTPFRLMGFVPSDNNDVIVADAVENIITGSSGGLFARLIRDRARLPGTQISYVNDYLPEESVDGVIIGWVDTFDANDMADLNLTVEEREEKKAVDAALGGGGMPIGEFLELELGNARNPPSVGGGAPGGAMTLEELARSGFLPAGEIVVED